MTRQATTAVLLALAACASYAQAPGAGSLRMRIGQAAYYVREFENEVARQRGGEKMVWRSKRDALEKVKALKTEAPDDPEVELLFQRVKKALMHSKGDYTDVAASWTAYLHNEEELRRQLGAEADAAWAALLDAHKDNLLAKAYPTPDFKEVSVDDLRGKMVVLDDVEYPMHQFYGATGEYVFCGKPSSGLWFLDISGRDWLGPYEAVKRYRRGVDTELEDVKKWTVLAEVADITMENPHPSEEGAGKMSVGWTLKPVALRVPGRVMAVYDKESEFSGRYIGEEKVEKIKDGWYTVKEIPPDVTPERLAEIFMVAIKEKNYKLYLDCIDPERGVGEYGMDDIRYHWDLHQKRFHGEYVHAAFGKARITVQKGFDENDSDENFFLDEEQRETLKRISGEKLEEAVVESRAYDAKGRQLGTPHPRKFIRRGGGRWYVLEYAPRF